MNLAEVRTRFAPSPTGFMHIGNLRTALYEYLIAKSLGGKFVLRFEDTDQKRKVDGAEELIYKTLKTVGLNHDEGPDIGGDYGPYVQSERLQIYKDYAQKLVKNGKAYYCFCKKDEIKNESDNNYKGYNRHCRGLTEPQINEQKAKNTPYVIRQKMPLEGSTTFNDLVYGEITVENKEIEDQILIKSDGYPTYNFANVVDDHLMKITHVVRGCEYLSSTPKYNLLYEAFGWEPPCYVHLPLIMGKNADGTVSKLSKRHGAVSFEDLINKGYLPKAVLNYIVLLGWSPPDTTEIFSLDDLTKVFDVQRINKSPSIFDYDKLNWFNQEYINTMSDEEFKEHCEPYIISALYGKEINKNLIGSPESFTSRSHEIPNELSQIFISSSKKTESKKHNLDLVVKEIETFSQALNPFLKEILNKTEMIFKILKGRIVTFAEIPEKINFLMELPKYNKEIFVNKKSKTTLENSLFVLKEAHKMLNDINEQNWNHDVIHEKVVNLAKDLGLKNGTVMFPIRVALSGLAVSVGGAIDLLNILGKEESLKRINKGIKVLSF